MKPLSGAALLFDIDGTLADTDPLHLEAFNRVFAPYGEVFDKPRFARELQGLANIDIAANLLPQMGVAEGMAVLAGKEAFFRELAGAALHGFAAVLLLISRAADAGFALAAVTNAPRANAELILDSLGITEKFGAIVIAEELEHGKPHPLPYLEALRRLGAKAELSVAFEDSRTGIRSATAAGLVTVGVRSSLSHDELIAAGASYTTADYSEPELLDFISQTTGRSL